MNNAKNNMSAIKMELKELHSLTFELNQLICNGQGNSERAKALSCYISERVDSLSE